VRLAVLLVLSAAIALVMAGTSAAATFRTGISGTGQTTASDWTSLQLDVNQKVGGGSAGGTVIGTWPAGTWAPDSTKTTFTGDLSQGGCLLTQGNQSVVVAKLLPGDQFYATTTHGPRLLEWIVAGIEDNGGTGDRASMLLAFDTSGPNICNSPDPFSVSQPPMRFLVPLNAGNYSPSYSDSLDGGGKPVNLAIIDAGGLPVTVTDAPDPDGLDVTVGAGTGTVRLDTCGYETDVSAGSDTVINCGSVIVRVLQGEAEVVLGDGVTTVSVPAGAKAEVSGDETSGFIVQNEGTTDVVVTVSGVEATVPAGDVAPVEAWVFQGFFDPVANATLNPVKAGSAVPLKWRLLDSSHAPVTNLDGATLTVTPINCTTHAATGPTTAGATVGAFQKLGSGYYQLNWKTAAAYAGTCAMMHLDIGDGVTHDALFKFKS
jgi:hypothetical protein